LGWGERTKFPLNIVAIIKQKVYPDIVENGREEEGQVNPNTNGTRMGHSGDGRI
jgi:hypothetical protein